MHASSADDVADTIWHTNLVSVCLIPLFHFVSITGPLSSISMVSRCVLGSDHPLIISSIASSLRCNHPGECLIRSPSFGSADLTVATLRTDLRLCSDLPKRGRARMGLALECSQDLVFPNAIFRIPRHHSNVNLCVHRLYVY